MALSPKISPNRRRSIAVLNLDASKSQQARRRRAHSIAPGDKLSPFTRSRRSLGPRKSILKQTQKNDDETTQAMELTAIQPSLLRRVSFAKDTHIRLFQKQSDNTNSTGTPPSSPIQDPDPVPSTVIPVNDENAYPGAGNLNRSRRRSSLRRSFGTDIGAGEQSMELDMDDTAPTPLALLQGDDSSIIRDNLNEFDDQDDFDGSDDMDLTEIVRRRSIALARRRSSMGFRSQPPPEDLSREDGSDVSGSVESVENHQAGHIEYTMPLGQSLREPSPPPDEWHALRAMTHAGNLPVSDPQESDQDDDMDLGDAMSRLRAARDSLMFSSIGEHNRDDEQEPLDAGSVQHQGFKDASFASTDSDSLDDDMDIASDKTINLTGALRRESLGGSSKESTINSNNKTGQSSTTNTEDVRVNKAILPPPEAHDKNPIYPDLSQFALADQSTPSASLLPVFQKSNSLYPNLTVFSKPPTAGPSTANAEASAIVTPKLPTITQLQRHSVFSSNTKPASNSLPSPGRLPNQTASSSTLKRPVSAIHGNTGRQTPAKKQATVRVSSGLPSSPTKPAGQSGLGKKVPFSPRKPSSPAKERVSFASGMRKTSATFVQRKSLGHAALPFDNGVRRPAGKSTESMNGQGEGERSSPAKQNPPPITQTSSIKSLSPALGSSHEREAPLHASAVPSSSEGSLLPDSAVISSRPASPQPALHMVSQGDAVEEHLSEVGAEHVDGDDMTERWRDGVQVEVLPEDDRPPISIEQFLAMTGVRFMDELAAPRRSTILPSLLSTSTSSEAGGDISLADYVVSMSVDLPHWMLYTGVSDDLLGMVDGIKDFYKTAEKDVEQDVPALFHEFADADDEWKEEILHQLKLIKANNHAVSRSQWYDWKLFWVGQLYEAADDGFTKLESDAKILERIIEETQELLPALREEYEHVMKENEKEAEEVAEIEQCDQEYLMELKTSIAEQSSELDVFRTEVAETTAKLERLKERSAEIEAEQKEARDAISDCERIIQIQKNSTKEEVFQLKEKLDALQELHLWRATRIASDMTQFTYAARYTVSIPCIRFKPVPSKVTISRLAPPLHKRRDPYPHLSDLTLHTAQARVSAMKGGVTNRQILQFLSDFWTSVVQLRSQLDVLAVRYPVSVEAFEECDDTTLGFKAVTSVLFSKFKAKAFVKFIFDADTFSNWPMSLASTQCEVEVAYGHLDQQHIRGTVLQHLSQVNMENLHGCLLNACTDAVEQS